MYDVSYITTTWNLYPHPCSISASVSYFKWYRTRIRVLNFLTCLVESPFPVPVSVSLAISRHHRLRPLWINTILGKIIPLISSYPSLRPITYWLDHQARPRCAGQCRAQARHVGCAMGHNPWPNMACAWGGLGLGGPTHFTPLDLTQCNVYEDLTQVRLEWWNRIHVAGLT